MQSTQLDEATATLIRELGFDPSQFTKTQAAQILEMLNSIQTTETPTPELDQAEGYDAVSDDEDEYEDEESDNRSSDWEGYAADSYAGVEPGSGEPQNEPLGDVESYAYQSEQAKPQLQLQEDKVQESSDAYKPKLTKKKSSKFFESVKTTVRSAFSFWKNKDKKSDQGKRLWTGDWTSLTSL